MHNRVAWLLNGRIGDIFETNIAHTVKNDGTHGDGSYPNRVNARKNPQTLCLVAARQLRKIASKRVPPGAPFGITSLEKFCPQNESQIFRDRDPWPPSMAKRYFAAVV